MTQDSRFTFVKVDESASEHIAAPQYSYWKSVFRRFFSSKVAIFMLILIIVIILMAIIHPMISGYDNLNMENINDPTSRFLRPSLEHLFGTDSVGRDQFNAVWSGTRTSLFASFAATAVTTIIGVIVGMFWGFSKRLDVIMIEIYNVIANIPYTLVCMLIMYTFGAGLVQLIFAMSCTTWISTAYFIRVQVMIIRDRDYNLASRCLGTPMSKMITHNILPYLISVIMTSISRDVPSFISSEVFLSYLGVGLGQSYASLGRLVQDAVKYIQSAPYLLIFPLVVAASISVSLYIVGQTLADASDPRTHMI